MLTRFGLPMSNTMRPDALKNYFRFKSIENVEKYIPDPFVILISDFEMGKRFLSKKSRIMNWVRAHPTLKIDSSAYLGQKTLFRVLLFVQ